MSPLSGAALLCLACVCLRDADHREHATALRLLALLLGGAAFMVFRAHEAGPAPYFLLVGGVTAFGTVVALLGAFWPRAVWAMAFVAAATLIIGST